MKCKDHCEHLINTVHTSFNTTREYVCCNCGEKRSKVIENSAASWTEDGESKHGPHLPIYKPMF